MTESLRILEEVGALRAIVNTIRLRKLFSLFLAVYSQLTGHRSHDRPTWDAQSSPLLRRKRPVFLRPYRSNTRYDLPLFR
jgi:hypothetical protein